MKKKTIICTIIVGLIFVAIGVIGIVASQDKNTTTENTTPTATVAPSEPETMAPTETLTPTETVEATPTLVPTEAVATATPTPTATSTPTPTVAPTATPIPTESSLYEYEIQRGENVWYRFTEDTLYVTGTGAIDDWKNYGFSDRDVELKNRLNKVKNIVIGEGIDVIGEFSFAEADNAEELHFPSTITSIKKDAFLLCGISVADKKITVTGLDKDRIEIAQGAFTWANIDDAELIAAPKMTPTPTPFVLVPEDVDPNAPKMTHKVQMGDNVYFEFYDNGELYVKGSGKTWDMPELFCWAAPGQRNGKDIPMFDFSFAESFQKCYVDDTITHIGNMSLSGFVFDDAWCPVNVTVGRDTGFHSRKMHLKTAEGTVTVTAGRTISISRAINAYKNPTDEYTITKE